MNREIDGVWNTDPDMDRLERQREAELDAQENCTGGADPAAPPAATSQATPPVAESPVQHMDIAERDRRHICHSVTDAQAEALIVMRLRYADPSLMFSPERWSDGVRLVIDDEGAPIYLMAPDGTAAAR